MIHSFKLKLQIRKNTNIVTMRTVKHQLKPLAANPDQENKFLDLDYAYQMEKNYFSDQLLNKSNKASLFNIHDSYITIQGKLVKNKYSSKYQLPARIWKMALKEAYDLHIRTYEAQIALIKSKINKKIYNYILENLDNLSNSSKLDKL